MVFQHRFSHLHGANVHVSPFLMTEQSLSILNGCNVSYELGAILKDTGYARAMTVGESGKSITGAFDFIQQPGTQKFLYTVNDATDDDTQLFYNNAGTSTEIAAAETAWANFANINVEMESFIGYTFFVGYGATDGFLPVGSLTGTTFSTSAQVTDMAQGKYIVRYRDRLYVLNSKSGGTAYPFRVYFSSVPSAGSITWTPATDFFDLDYSDEIKGGAENWDLLVIFTQDKAYYYNQQAVKTLFWQGCSSHRTIKNNGVEMYFVNRKGVYVSRGGGEPQNISGPIQDFIRNGNTANMFAEMIEEEYHLYMGNVTVKGRAYANVKATFNVPLQSWRWRELGHTMSIFAKYNDISNDSERLYMGSTSGVIYDKSKYTDTTIYSSDGVVGSTEGLSINSEFELAPFVVEPDKYKALTKVVAYADRAGGLKLKYRIIDKSSRILTPYRPLGTLDKFQNDLKVHAEAGSLIQIYGTENGKLPYWSFYGASYDLIKLGSVNK